MRLSDMLKRKRVSSRKSSRKSTGASSRDEAASGSSSATPGTSATPGGSMPTFTPSKAQSSAASASSGGKSASTTPGRRSRLSSASSLLSSLHPSRWVRGGSGASAGAGAEQTSATQSPAATPTHHHHREKVKIWVRDQAGRFLEQHFRESLGSRRPALTILRRLSAQVDHLAKKPRDGERCLREIQSILVENDISPFEVTQSGLVPSLLSYLTKPDSVTADSGSVSHSHHSTTPPSGSGQVRIHMILSSSGLGQL